MSRPKIPAQGSRRTGSLRFACADVDAEWERERDARLAKFIAQRLADAEATGCGAERKLAAGIGDVFTEWNMKRELVQGVDNDQFAGQVSALGWVLRCIAHSSWRSAPGWDPAFHPQAVSQEITHRLA